MKNHHGKSRPFILYPKKDINEIRDCVLENYGSIKYELPFLNALCVEIPESGITSIKTNQRVAMMSEDVRVSKLPLPAKDSSCFLSSCQSSSYRCPYCGEGICIAIIDTGVSPHYDLVKPFNRIIAFKDFVGENEFPYDDDGHGTHVAGIALGNGYLSNGARHCGSAPKAALAALKALDGQGSGNMSDILAAMQWVYDHHKKYNIRVVNLSLGVLPDQNMEIDPLAVGANALVCAGVSVVAAAGNSGPKTGTISSPGTSPLVLTVGSCDDNHKIPDFSSRGPTLDGTIKPDLIAPGVNVSSLVADDCKGYVEQTGTSMSAPYVAGLAASLYSEHPQACPSEIKNALIHSATPIKKADRNAQGHGLLLWKCIP
ncbi:MAG: S8 family peptidase [Anaerovoracaceae bacterium]